MSAAPSWCGCAHCRCGPGGSLPGSSRQCAFLQEQAEGRCILSTAVLPLVSGGARLTDRQCSKCSDGESGGHCETWRGGEVVGRTEQPVDQGQGERGTWKEHSAHGLCPFHAMLSQRQSGSRSEPLSLAREQAPWSNSSGFRGRRQVVSYPYPINPEGDLFFNVKISQTPSQMLV